MFTGGTIWVLTMAIYFLANCSEWGPTLSKIVVHENRRVSLDQGLLNHKLPIAVCDRVAWSRSDRTVAVACAGSVGAVWDKLVNR